MLQSLLPIAGLLGPFHHPSCPSPPHSLPSYTMLNPLAPPFVYGGASSEAAASFDMGHSFFSYPSLAASSCAPSSSVFTCSAGNGWNEKHYYHHHFHFFANGMTPSTISYYSCFPTQLPPPLTQLHPYFPFQYQPTKVKLEEIDGRADGSEEHQLVMTKKQPEIVHFYPCKDEKIPCFVRRKRGGGKRFVTACWEQNAGSRVHPAPRKSSELKHDGAGSRVRRGHAAVGAWVPKAKLPVELEGAKPEEVKLDVEDANAEKTTLMIKNIPNRFNRGNLISILDGLCKREDGTEEEAAAGAYDFLYLPIDFQ